MKKFMSKLLILLVCAFTMALPIMGSDSVSAYTVTNDREYVYYMGLQNDGSKLFAVSQKYYTSTSGLGNTDADHGPLKTKENGMYKDITPKKIDNNTYGLCSSDVLPEACNNTNIASLYKIGIYDEG